MPLGIAPQHRLQFAATQLSPSRRLAVCAVLAIATASTLHSVAPAQTLARPGWAGSGLTVTEWWRNAVLFEVVPERGEPTSASVAVPAASPPLPSARSAVNQLTDLAGRLDDLQALGADAMLLRGIDGGGTAPQQSRVAANYGTLDEFDDLLREASRRRIRVLVELPGTLNGDALRSAARFWLSRGVSGLALGPADPSPNPAASSPAPSAGATANGPGPAPDNSGRAAQVSLLQDALRGYVGERVLLVDAMTSNAGGRGSAPEMVSIVLRGFVTGQPTDVAAVRQSLLAAREVAGSRRGGTVARIDPQAGTVHGNAAEARASVLLMVAGGVALRTGEIGEGPGAQAAAAARAQAAQDEAALAAATSPAGISNVKRAIAARAKQEPPRFAGDPVFLWTERMIGLHRGNPAMLHGEQKLLDHDRDGAIVSVWRGATGQLLCEVVNLRETPVDLSLTEEFSAMHAHGSFLRPLARNDAGMGALPLAHIRLKGFGVFLGELGR